MNGAALMKEIKAKIIDKKQFTIHNYLREGCAVHNSQLNKLPFENYK